MVSCEGTSTQHQSLVRAWGRAQPGEAAQSVLPQARIENTKPSSVLWSSAPPPAPPAPTDREGLARVTYNHYNSFFPVDAAGKMLWRDIDDKYCLSYGEARAALSACSAF